MFIALVNPKSGGNIGNHLLLRFSEILDEDRIYNLSEVGGPRRALMEHRHTDNLRIIACGGDGTVGWILSVMDDMEFPPAERPAIGIIPLGTGNDLARSLSWGGKFRDKPLRKVLIDIHNADIIDLDRWSLSYCPLSEHGDTPEEIANADDKLPLDVLNNYFSVGIDAHIALQFHKARNSNPEHFTSRTRNLLFYGLAGGKDLFKHQWRNLMDHVTIECDGIDYTQRLKAYGTHSVMFLNIRSYAGGTKPWNRKYGPQCMNDGLLEVVAIDNLDLAILHAGGSGASVCQCKRAVITTNSCVPMQIDGEPCLMKPCKIVIEYRNRSKVLVRNKTASLLFMVLRHGRKRVFEVKERLLPPAILTDPKWGEHGYLQLPGLKLHYVEKGDHKKPLMLMLHGFPEFWFSWRHQLLHFSKDYWCVAIDNRGYGDTEKPTGIDQYHLDKLAADVKHVIEALGQKKCILLGHDWGGAIGYYFAGKYPEMVDQYVVVNLPHPLSLARQLTKGWDQRLKSWYMLFFQCPIIPERFMRLGDMNSFDLMMKDIQFENRDQLCEAYKYTFRDANAFQGPINYYRAASQLSVTHKPKLNDVPVFSVYGNQDAYLSVSAFKGSRDFVQDFQECPIEGVSHWAMIEAPQQVNSAIESYLNNKRGKNK